MGFVRGKRDLWVDEEGLGMVAEVWREKGWVRGRMDGDWKGGGEYWVVKEAWDDGIFGC